MTNDELDVLRHRKIPEGFSPERFKGFCERDSFAEGASAKHRENDVTSLVEKLRNAQAEEAEAAAYRQLHDMAVAKGYGDALQAMEAVPHASTPTTDAARRAALEEAAKVADGLAGIAKLSKTHAQPLPCDTNEAWRRIEDAALDIAFRIRALADSQETSA